ncbi:MAG: bacterio-opsin activator, partial [Lachnospiraceae bacterium]
MAINNNQSKKHRIYLKATRQWVEVSETVYREHTRFYDAFRKKAQYHGQCICPKNKFWLCDG